MPTKKHSRTLELIPVDRIVTDVNVRADATPDADLVASVKANGLLQPPTVVRLDNGDFQLVIGHRRAAAAAAAGLEEIEALVLNEPLTGDARLVEQIVENDQRLNLTDAERAGGYQQLSLLQVSPAQIARRLGVKRNQVDSTLKVKANTLTAAAVDRGVPLDLAAELLEFTDHPDIVASLSDVALTTPARLAHEIAAARREIALLAHVDALRAELAKHAKKGVRILDDLTGWIPTDAQLQLVSRYAHPDDSSRPLTGADIVGKPYAAAAIYHGTMPRPDGTYGTWARIEWFVTDPADHDLRPVGWDRNPATTREPTPEDLAARAAAEKAAADFRAHTSALAEAATVRRQWLTALLNRPSLPEVHEILLPLAFTYDGFYLGGDSGYPPLALTLLDHHLEDGSDFDDPYEAGEYVERLLDDAASIPSLGRRILFAATLAIAEETHVSTASWGRAGISYLTLLERWGYGISDAEALARTNALTRIATAEAMNSVDPDDDIED